MGVRERESVVGNASILRVVKYICEVHGIDLGSVAFVAHNNSSGIVESRKSLGEFQLAKRAAARRSSVNYSWPELQVGLIRESLAVAEALPGVSVCFVSNKAGRLM